ncbi:hypothetical protein ACJX0J_014602, partial [Zea mays]
NAVLIHGNLWMILHVYDDDICVMVLLIGTKIVFLQHIYGQVNTGLCIHFVGLCIHFVFNDDMINHNNYHINNMTNIHNIYIIIFGPQVVDDLDLGFDSLVQMNIETIEDKILVAFLFNNKILLCFFLFVFAKNGKLHSNEVL